MDQPNLSASQEDYLEAILALEQTHKVARVKDIAKRLGILQGSVTGALKTLAEKQLVNYEPYSFITLTRTGKKLASEIAHRHRVIQAFLKNVLLMAPERAEANACRMEHAMDREAIDRLVKFLEYIHACPRTGQDWIQAFVNYYANDRVDDIKCHQCLKDCMARFEADR